jgi:hypothetical protein
LTELANNFSTIVANAIDYDEASLSPRGVAKILDDTEFFTDDHESYAK